jgi:hypothetical protein
VGEVEGVKLDDGESFSVPVLLPPVALAEAAPGDGVETPPLPL